MSECGLTGLEEAWHRKQYCTQLLQPNVRFFCLSIVILWPWPRPSAPPPPPPLHPVTLPVCLRLQLLDVGRNRLHQWAALAPLQSMMRLRNLNLQGNRVCSLKEYTAKVHTVVGTSFMFVLYTSHTYQQTRAGTHIDFYLCMIITLCVLGMMLRFSFFNQQMPAASVVGLIAIACILSGFAFTVSMMYCQLCGSDAVDFRMVIQLANSKLQKGIWQIGVSSLCDVTRVPLISRKCQTQGLRICSLAAIFLRRTRSTHPMSLLKDWCTTLMS